MKNHLPSHKQGVTSRDWSLGKGSRRNRRQAYHYLIKYNNNFKNMIIFYKKLKKYNEIQLTKNKMDLNIWKMTNHPQKKNNCQSSIDKKQNGLKYSKNDKSSTLPEDALICRWSQQRCLLARDVNQRNSVLTNSYSLVYILHFVSAVTN